MTIELKVKTVDLSGFENFQPRGFTLPHPDVVVQWVVGVGERSVSVVRPPVVRCKGGQSGPDPDETLSRLDQIPKVFRIPHCLSGGLVKRLAEQRRL